VIVQIRCDSEGGGYSKSEKEWLDIFSGNLRDMLDDANMSQRELADATGLSDAAISYYINGEKIPGVKALVNISYALDCSLDELMDFGDRIR
jgi:transcriptional regulator with XRE-family HTH domain